MDPEVKGRPTTSGNHFSCSMSAVLLARVHACGGDGAVAELLRLAGSTRTVAYLSEISNWISYDEASALWRAGSQVTHHPSFSRSLGEEAARRLNASPVAALLRSLGSPEAVYRQIAVTATKFATVTTLEAGEVGPGFAEITARAVTGFPRSAEHCAWTCGLLTQTTVLFGLPPAMVNHESCEALGAPECLYSIRWADPGVEDGEREADDGLREQLDALRDRLHSMFAIAADLSGTDDIADVLARITDRAAVEVRAPRYLLAVRTGAAGKTDLHCHHKGFAEAEVEAAAARILSEHPASFPESWLVAPVRSTRSDYGRLLAMGEPGAQFFPQERELFEVYAQYAATALDGATALLEAKNRYRQSSALLGLARALAAAGTSDEVARRLAEAVPMVVDCDRVGVYIWDGAENRLRRRAAHRREGLPAGPGDDEWVFEPTPGGALAAMLEDPTAPPMFIDAHTGDPLVRDAVAKVGAEATILVPIATSEALLGVLAVLVTSDPERLAPSPDLLDRLSGVAAQATTALQNGKLVDQITHQALHDQLTGLANRLQLTDKLRSSLRRARQEGSAVTLFYIDLDGFKPVNDEFGHEVGDHLLVAVGERLAGCTRATDTVSRLGGDEFAVLIDCHDTGHADLLAERVAGALSQPFHIDGHRLHLGASIGRAEFPVDGTDAESLLRFADASMFEAKRSRRVEAARTA